MKEARWIAIVAALLILLTACNNQKPAMVENSKVQAAATELTVVNNKLTQIYTEVPKRAISMNQHVTEIMLALGLEKSMVGTAYLDDTIFEPLQEAYNIVPVLAEHYPSKEQIIEAEADFVYAGWKSGFDEKGIGSQQELMNLGIHTYLHESSNMTNPKLDDVFADIRTIAAIFQVEERGNELISQISSDIEAMQYKVPQGKKKPNVLVYDSGEKDLFTAAQNFTNELVHLAGGVNIFGDIEAGWTTVSKEDAVDRNPDVVVVVDYGETSAAAKIEFLKNDPALKETAAVKNERFVILPLSAASEGVRAAEAIEILAEGFYPDQF